MKSSQPDMQSQWAALVADALAIPGTPPGRHMDAATAQAYAQDRLGPEALAEADAHLAACPRCAGRMVLVVEIWEGLLRVARWLGPAFAPERRLAEVCALTDPDKLAAVHRRWRLAKGIADWASTAASAVPVQVIRQWLAELDRELSMGWAVLLQGSHHLAGLAARALAPEFQARRPAQGIGDSPAVAQLQEHLRRAAEQLQAGQPEVALGELAAAGRLDARAVQCAEMELLHQGRRVGLVVVDGRRRTVQIKAFGGPGGISPVLAVLVPDQPGLPLQAVAFTLIPGEEPNRLAVFEQVPDGCFGFAVGPLGPPEA